MHESASHSLSKLRIIAGLEGTMHPATKLQFERAVHEYIRWRAVPEDERSPAPAWWWGPAFEARGVMQPIPVEWCTGLELPDSSSFADGANVFLESLAEQTALPWSGDFPRKAGHSNSA